ncbi:MAG: SDR family oxidoreductase [Rhodobacteraceae bacterium]|nr:SDR family oxidoreductase [Paracoccaceae bacterium]
MAAAFDYVIVGAGADGCVLANRLSVDPGTRVCLVDAGPDRNARRAIVRVPLAMVTYMAPALAFLGGPRLMFWFETEPEPGLQGRAMALPRGQGTGGSTNVNGQIFIRGQREDFDHWRDLGNPGWGHDDLLPYFRNLERFEILDEPRSARHIRFGERPLAEQIDPSLHGLDGPPNVAPLRSVNPMAEVFLDAAQRAGHPLNPDFNGARQNGVGLYTFKQSNGERVTAEGAYLDTVRARPNLTVMADTKVTRLLLDGRRVTGVAYRRGGEEGALAAREVILSAGCFVSPHLLMLSGIGNARDLDRHGIAPVHDLPGVGENLQDHLDITLEYRARSTAPYGVSWRALPRNVLHVLDWFARGRGLFASTAGEGGGFVSTDPASDRPDIQLFFCTGRANTQEASGFAGHGFLMHVCQLRPGSIGRLTLRSADPADKPSILYSFFRGDSSMEPLRRGHSPGAADRRPGPVRAASRRRAGSRPRRDKRRRARRLHPREGQHAVPPGRHLLDGPRRRGGGRSRNAARAWHGGTARGRRIAHARHRVRQHRRGDLLPRREGRRPDPDRIHAGTAAAPTRTPIPGENPMTDFNDRTILVTGASGGIGGATVRQLVAANADVIASGRSQEALDVLAQETGCRALVFDLTGENAVRGALEGLDLWGVVNCGGFGGEIATPMDTDIAVFDKVIAINARGALLVTKYASQSMVRLGKGGSIVNVSSQASLVALSGHISYGSSKAALDNITRVSALELGRYNIRVNSVNPTVVMTEMSAFYWGRPDIGGPFLEAMPLRRWATEDEIAAPIVFLLSDGASMISGVSLSIDGGFTCRWSPLTLVEIR